MQAADKTERLEKRILNTILTDKIPLLHAESQQSQLGLVIGAVFHLAVLTLDD